jgi:hypothetical protein
MFAMTETTEKRMLSLLKRDDREGLKIVTGPDGRLRLVLDKSCRVGSRENAVNDGCLVADNVEPDEDKILVHIRE